MDKPRHIDIPMKKERETVTYPSHSISVWIDTYDDIFSDFDPRPYENRNISDDFLYEIKKFSSEKDSLITGFTLLIPEAKRDFKVEEIIEKRLHQYFKKTFEHLKRKTHEKRRNGVIQTFLGTVLMIAASYISFINAESFLMHSLFVLFEPAGWFLLWMGLENLIYRSKTEQKELSFYKKIIKTKITFLNI